MTWPADGYLAFVSLPNNLGTCSWDTEGYRCSGQFCSYIPNNQSNECIAAVTTWFDYRYETKHHRPLCPHV